jgi:hypothetical protein
MFKLMYESWKHVKWIYLRNLWRNYKRKSMEMIIPYSTKKALGMGWYQCISYELLKT